MNVLLEMPEVRQQVSPISVAEYHTLGEFNENGRRTELICGIIIEKMPKSPLHYFMVNRVREILAEQISPEFTLRTQDPITTSDSEPEPDVIVVRGTPSDFRRAHPSTAELAVEVAISSLKIDRVKARIYAEAGVKEYWIVCPEITQVEVYRKPEAGGYALHEVITAPAILEVSSLSGLRVDLAALFA